MIFGIHYRTALLMLFGSFLLALLVSLLLVMSQNPGGGQHQLFVYGT